jgi:hypothetical protein
MIFLKITLILYCIGFIWGSLISSKPYWWLRGIIGGFLFAMCYITIPIALISKVIDKPKYL